MLELYVKTWCPWCVLAIETLDALGCAYQVHDVEKEPNGQETLLALSGQTRVPTLRLEGAVLADFGPEEIAPFLRQQGVLPSHA